MPLPIILGGVALVAGLAGLASGANGVKKIRDASKQIEEASTNYETSKAKLDDKEMAMNQSLDSVGSLQIKLNKDFSRFADAFEKIQNRPEFSEYTSEHPSISKHDLNEIRQVSITAIEFLASSAFSAGAGALAGFAAYGGTMALGVASTGTAISSLSGIAAYNATLAALGGGSIAAGGGGMALGSTILAGAVVGPVVAVAGLLVNAKGNSSLEKAAEIERKVDEAVALMVKAMAFMDKLTVLSNDVLAELNTLSIYYYKYVGQLEGLVATNTDWNSYSDQQQQLVDDNIKLISIIRAILKQPLVVKTDSDEMGEIQEAKVRQGLQNAKELTDSL